MRCSNQSLQLSFAKEQNAELKRDTRSPLICLAESQSCQYFINKFVIFVLN